MKTLYCPYHGTPEPCPKCEPPLEPYPLEYIREETAKLPQSVYAQLPEIPDSENPNEPSPTHD